MKKLTELQEHLTTSLEKDQDGKNLLRITLNDCLVINGHSTATEVDAANMTKKEAKVFPDMSRFRHRLVKDLINRGRYYFACKILNNLVYFQQNGMDAKCISDESLSLKMCRTATMRIVLGRFTDLLNYNIR